MRLFTNSETDNDSTGKDYYHTDEHENVSTDNDELSEDNNEDIESKPIERLIEEDALLIQIDEFRKKAVALQSLINDKQEKVIDLEATVREKENKNVALQEELAKKQEALNEILGDMKSQFDILADRVDTSVVNAVESAKEPVMDKIHSENVRLYRNISDFIKGDYSKEDIEKLIKDNTKFDNRPAKVSLFISLVNTALIVFIILFTMGII